ncbi:hypothetical protein HO173_008066 [Letharia columbiana]|uniref:Uncharacterized protein n=1 Tax=Letharia columbiana TaxID=112416 RepID=A0A8H6FSB8_9LECA|nr:uncharacterized protein HO173_008066 [Letharia columbiana]KAF6233854.1 hypothetical protein HO173_008066 [Letharia columbiana]
MCSECGDVHEPLCSYCGESCYGECNDPDVCPSCWIPANDPDDFDEAEFIGEAFSGCIDERCICQCHETFFEDEGWWVEAGVLKMEDVDGLPYVRTGVFPFLKLPGEIRDKIYCSAFLQDGNQRKCASHRGNIHTALLGTCRQVYNEARHLPLTTNKLCFNSPIYAHDFLGFLLAPTQHDLVTGMHIEFYIGEFSNSSWALLLRELTKMPITHIGLTVKGKFPKEVVSEHVCFTNRFKVLKGLKTFDLILTPSSISKGDKKDIQETMRENLIKDYVRPKELTKSKAKRMVSTESNEGSKKPAKKVKKGNSMYQTKIFASPRSSRLGLKSQKFERDAAKAAKERAKQNLLDQYNQLKQYATSLDTDATPVKIRLEQAREAAEAIDETKFEKLAHGIFLTLEERYNKIAAARTNVPVFRAPVQSSKPTSSQELCQSLDSQSISQSSI